MAKLETIIGIAGASGAGKSRLANQLFDRLVARSADDVAILHEDAYYRRRDELTMEQREKINYDHPDAMEHDLLIRHLSELKNGQPVDVPIYDYSVHNRSPRTRRLKPTRVLFLEGILILHQPEMRQLMDLKIYVDVPLDICLARRLRRDVKSRGRSIDSVLSQYLRTVRPMFFEFIQPSKEFADIIVPRGGDNLTAQEVLFSHVERVLGEIPPSAQSVDGEPTTEGTRHRND